MNRRHEELRVLKVTEWIFEIGVQVVLGLETEKRKNIAFTDF